MTKTSFKIREILSLIKTNDYKSNSSLFLRKCKHRKRSFLKKLEFLRMNIYPITVEEDKR